MFAAGQKIYFKRAGDVRLLKGVVLEVTRDGIQVRGCRTATKITPPVFMLQAHEINTDYVPEKLRTRKLETGYGNSLSIPVAESLRRQQIVVERLQMSEAQLLQCRALLEIRRRAVRDLACQNRIPSRNMDFDELSSEYVIAQLASLRATAASATDADIREFKRYLAGETDYSRVFLTVCRTSRTAAMRYLKRRDHWNQLHVNLFDCEHMLMA